MESIITRTMELHHFTISGIGKKQNYCVFLQKLLSEAVADGVPVLKLGGKSHVLSEVVEARDGEEYSYMRFYSYKTGSRPDIITITSQHIEESPLSVDQTFIEWTHALIISVQHVWYLGIEKNSQGIFPKSIEKYLQWLCDKYINTDGKDVSISVEPVPSAEFIERLKALSSVKKATIRYARPNPCDWDELESSILQGADESYATKAKVEMSSGKNAGLSQTSGIVKEIRDKYEQHTLGYASIEGVTAEGKNDMFNTSKLITKDTVSTEVDDNGRIIKSSLLRCLKNFALRMLK